MKLKKHLNTLSDLLDADHRERVKHYDELKKVLKKLKKKRNELREELESADAGKRERIRERLEIIDAERHKGIRALKEAKRERDT